MEPLIKRLPGCNTVRIYIWIYKMFRRLALRKFVNPFLCFNGLCQFTCWQQTKKRQIPVCTTTCSPDPPLSMYTLSIWPFSIHVYLAHLVHPFPCITCSHDPALHTKSRQITCLPDPHLSMYHLCTWSSSVQCTSITCSLYPLLHIYNLRSWLSSRRE